MSENKEITANQLKKFLSDNLIKVTQIAAVGYDVDKGIKAALLAAGDSWKIRQCDPMSILRSVCEAAYYGLEVSGAVGGADLIARWDFKKKEYYASFQPNFYGYQRLVRQGDPNIVDLDAREWYEGDSFEIVYGTKPFINHIPCMSTEKRGDWLGVYTMVLYRSGRVKFEHMLRPDIEYIRDTYSDGWKAYQAGKISTNPWLTSPVEMGKKTCFLKMKKWLELGKVRQLMDFDEKTEAGQTAHSPVDTANIVAPVGHENMTHAGKMDDIINQQASPPPVAGKPLAIEAPKERVPDILDQIAGNKTAEIINIPAGNVVSEPAEEVLLQPAGDRCIACTGVGMDSNGGICKPCGGSGEKRKPPENGLPGPVEKVLTVVTPEMMNYICCSCTLPFPPDGIVKVDADTYLCTDCNDPYTCAGCKAEKNGGISPYNNIGHGKYCPPCFDKLRDKVVADIKALEIENVDDIINGRRQCDNWELMLTVDQLKKELTYLKMRKGK